MSTEPRIYRAYIIERGAYYGTPEDRADRWYYRSVTAETIDRRGPGVATLREARAEIDHRISMAGAE